MHILWLVIAAIGTAAIPTEARAQIIYGNPSAVDGDTLDFGGERVRLFGIDAPEAAQTCERDNQTWSCGAEAKAMLEGLIAGQRVNCRQRDIDRFGRSVAVCEASRIDLSEALARAGMAIALEQFSAAYVSAAEMARQSGLGIWAGTFQTPADFRASDKAFLAEEAEFARRRERERAQVAAPNRPTRPARSDTYFRNCREAWAAGAAPLRRGEPGYRLEMDGDGDGVACEPYRPR